MAEVMILSSFWIDSDNDVEFGHDRKTIKLLFWAGFDFSPDFGLVLVLTEILKWDRLIDFGLWGFWL